jgi:SAM-dependent methyltransferase
VTQPLRPKPNRELEVGSTAHFEDPDYYTSAYRQRSADVIYYLELAVSMGVSVLEYGCGNGRITLPLARSGLEVMGVDRSPAMLGDLRRRLRAEPAGVRQRVRVRLGDMRSLRLGRRYGLVLCTFNTLLHLYERSELERFLARARDHLAPGGRLVFDVSVPDPVELARRPERAYHAPRFRHASTGELVRYSERFDYDPLSQVLFVTMEFEPLGRPSEAWTTPLAHRQFYPRELEALLHYNGFRVIDLHADFAAQPPDRETATLIYHCTPRPSANKPKPRR